MQTHKWEDNIKKDLREARCECAYWVQLILAKA